MMGFANAAVTRLSQVVAEVNDSASALVAASEQVSSTAQPLSQAASEQAASVEESSASMEEMTASITQNTENAKVTDAMASKAAKEALEGGKGVRTTVSAMKQIATKIVIIDDIACQTNLRALNAAILVQEITAASEEQVSGVSQISAAMTQLSDTTQQNAAGSEQLASTAEEMSRQAEELQQTMAFFHIGGSDGGRRARAPVRKAVKSTTAPRIAARKMLSSEVKPDEAQFTRF